MCSVPSLSFSLVTMSPFGSSTRMGESKIKNLSISTVPSPKPSGFSFFQARANTSIPACPSISIFLRDWISISKSPAEYLPTKSSLAISSLLILACSLAVLFFSKSLIILFYPNFPESIPALARISL